MRITNAFIGSQINHNKYLFIPEIAKNLIKRIWHKSDADNGAKSILFTPRDAQKVGTDVSLQAKTLHAINFNRTPRVANQGSPLSCVAELEIPRIDKSVLIFSSTFTPIQTLGRRNIASSSHAARETSSRPMDYERLIRYKAKCRLSRPIF